MAVTGDGTFRLQTLPLKLMLTASVSLLNGCFIFAGAKSQEKLMVRFFNIAIDLTSMVYFTGN